MRGEQRDLSIDELSEQTGVPVRTIRYYVSEGLLPGPGARGKAATYGEEHLWRLHLIRLLSAQRVPLTEQREYLGRLSPDEVRALCVAEEQRLKRLERTRRMASPKAYISELLRQARQSRELPLPEREPSPAVPAPTRQRPMAWVRTDEAPMWRRFELAPGMEFHVREDMEKAHRRLIERVLRAARAELDRREQ